jgi:hypothetical protein
VLGPWLHFGDGGAATVVVREVKGPEGVWRYGTGVASDSPALDCIRVSCETPTPTRPSQCRAPIMASRSRHGVTLPLLWVVLRPWSMPSACCWGCLAPHTTC